MKPGIRIGVCLIVLSVLTAGSATARFVSVDPVQANPNTGQNFNRYHYANNNPYKFTDPDGREAVCLYTATRCGMEPMTPELREAQKTVANGMLVTAGVAALLLVPDPSDVVIGAAVGKFVLGMRASRGFSQAKRYIDSITDGLGATGGRSGRRTTEFEGQDGGAGASNLFDRLTNGKSVPRDGGRLGSLGDGSRVQMNTRAMRDGTKETSVRITSERTGSRIKDVIKVRFKETP